MAVRTILAWLIDLDRQIVEVHRAPSRAGYDEKRTYTPADALAPQMLPELSVAVADILGSAA
jgi:Uma2 family endonuclease